MEPERDARAEPEGISMGLPWEDRPGLAGGPDSPAGAGRIGLLFTTCKTLTSNDRKPTRKAERGLRCSVRKMKPCKHTSMRRAA